jgi:hypothetical protein
MNDSIQSHTMLPRRCDEAGGKSRVGRPPGMPDIADGGLVLAILIASRNTSVVEYTWKLRKLCVLYAGRTDQFIVAWVDGLDGCRPVCP